MVLWRAESEWPADGSLSFAIEDPDVPAAAGELHFYCEIPREARIRMEWNVSADDQPGRALTFDLSPTHAGPYRIRLDNLPAWVWGGLAERLTFKLERPANIGEIIIEIKSW